MKNKKNYSHPNQSRVPSNAKSSKTGASNSVRENDAKAGSNKSSMTLRK